MKYNISLFCLLLSSVTFIYSADPRQQTNPKGQSYTGSIENKTDEDVAVIIGWLGGTLNPFYHKTIILKPGETNIISHSALATPTSEFNSSQLFAGISIRFGKYAAGKSRSPIVDYIHDEDLPTGVRKVKDTITIQYLPGNKGVGILPDIHRIYKQ